MKLKSILSALLAAAMLCALLVAPVSAAGSSFPDVTDPATAEAAEILRALGIVSGTGNGLFEPNGTLTRAAFCKMALEAQGRGKEAAQAANRVVFPDVTAGHWALGYVNAAARATSAGEGKTTPALVSGKGDGLFHPDDDITYGEAITILMRMLGYSDADVGAGLAWFDGYLSTANTIELTKGINRTGTSVITRGEAAILFRNLLFTEFQDSESVFLTMLGGSVIDSAVILDLDATADDGTKGSIQVSDGKVYKTARDTFPPDMLGMRGRLVLDKSGQLIAVLPDENDTLRRSTVSGTPTASAIPLLGGEKASIKLDTVVWKDGKATTYDKVWLNLRTGTQVVLCYNGAGNVDYLFIPTGATMVDGALVARNKPDGVKNPFAGLAGGVTGWQMYKNGIPATAADLRQYDVAVYEKSSNTIQVTDFRLTGVYENVYPNTTAPSTVTMMGVTFDVLPGAVSDLQKFKIGDSMTLLLTPSGTQIAGALPVGTSKATAVGIAEIDDGEVKVTLINGLLTLSGSTTLSGTAAEELSGRLVTVSSSGIGRLNITRLTNSGATGNFNVAAGTMGGKSLAPNAKLFEQVSGSAITEITRDEITRSSVFVSDILFAHYDYAGRIDYMVFENITGDQFSYGYLSYTPSVTTVNPSDQWDQTFTPATVSVTNGDSKNATLICGSGIDASNGMVGGIVAQAGGTKLAQWIELTEIKKLSRTDFDLDAMELALSTAVYPISGKVQCLNKVTNTWYEPGEEGLRLILAFSDNLTVYYDRAPEQGGKIRMIVAEQ